AQFQVGANVGETISLDLETSMRRTDVGAVATATTVDLRTLITDAVEASAATSGSATFDATSLLADFGSGDTISFDVTDGTETATVTLSANYSQAGGIDDLVTDLGTAL